MFVTQTYIVWTEALKALIDSEPVGSPLKAAVVGIEYPMREVEYPSIWVNYAMQGDVKIAGIGHEENYWAPAPVDPGQDPDEPVAEEWRRATRWQFGGVVQFTVACMSNLQRSQMIDALTRAIAMARVGGNRQGTLREAVENSDLIGQIVTWDSITMTGFGEMQGTPWGTDDVLYEVTISLTTSGEVVVDLVTGALVPLSSVVVEQEELDTP